MFPLNLYMESDTSINSLSSNDTLNFNTKSYISDKGFYINEENTKQWVKYNDSDFKRMKAQLSKSLADQLVEYNCFILICLC
ncbi:DUF6612 family protein [Rummeliibacillus sp. NPDC094406]|uniref:DUF6612 family protein n=1 Tax=Rummeliibacillus sp. NPDC094406 TaxID=3364511 RepID=UPI00381D7103